MKNEDLIRKLSKYNKDADVTLTTSEDITLSYISNDGEFSKEDTPFIFIEPMDNCPECVHEYIHDDEGVKWCSFYDKPCRDVKECFQFEEFNDPF